MLGDLTRRFMKRQKISEPLKGFQQYEENDLQRRALL